MKKKKKRTKAVVRSKISGSDVRVDGKKIERKKVYVYQVLPNEIYKK